jgi:hypothetical protein
MKSIQQEEFVRLNRALYELEDILGCMGIKEFSLSKNKHNLQMKAGAEDIDRDLLMTFCHNIDQLHGAKFGQAAECQK